MNIARLSVPKLRKCLMAALIRIHQNEIVDTGSQDEIGPNGTYADMDDYIESLVTELLQAKP